MEQIRKTARSPFALLLVSAILSALPLTFSALFPLCWIALVPFFFVILNHLEGQKLSKAIFFGLFFGFCYHLFVYFWFLRLYPLDFAGLSGAESLFVVLLAWIGISFAHGSLFILPFLASRLVLNFTKNKGYLLFTAIVFFLLAEWIPSLSELAFPWVRLALGLYRAPVFIQFASVLGLQGVELLLLLCSAFLALAILEKSKRIFSLALAGAVFFGNLVFGLCRLSGPESGESITASLVQGNVLSAEKWYSENSLEIYTELAESALSSDLIVWPESALAQNLAVHPALLDALQTLSEELETPILTGCFWKLDGASSNSALLITPDSVSAPYTKRHLVPFGEKMPYRSVLSRLFPVLEEINMLSSDLAQGEESAIFETEKGKIGAIICFESIFPEITRQSVKDGAEMIALVTNDSWYEDSPAVWQHLAHAVFRSVENARSTLRCANSGVSAFIDSRGRITKKLDPLCRGVITEKISFSEERSIFTLLGNASLPAASFVWLLCGICLFAKERREIGARKK